jgi:diguanylate cyclase
VLSSGPFVDFNSASKAVLAFLHDNFGFDLWMVTRTDGDDWIVLQAKDNGYGVSSGDVFRWADSFCSQMVQGLGPCIAPKSRLIPAYAAAPIGRQVDIAAYIGFPLKDADGGLFGTLCAIDPVEKNESLQDAFPLLNLLGGLLSGYLATELKLTSQNRAQGFLELRHTSTDPLTKSFNREGWECLAKAEEVRCRAYGYPAHVIAVELDPSANESTIVMAASILHECLREHVAWLEFPDRVFSHFSMIAVPTWVPRLQGR